MSDFYINPSNVNFVRGGSPGHFDFECFSDGKAIFDIPTGAQDPQPLMDELSEKLKGVHTDKVEIQMISRAPCELELKAAE